MIKGNAMSQVDARFAKAVLCSCALIVLTSAQPVWAADAVSCAKTGLGPQAPRDILERVAGTNAVTFKAPATAQMHLCNIHFHKYAEHRAAGYKEQASQKGFVCNGRAPPKEAGHGSAASGCPGIANGDTIEIHWVFTTCDVKPGPTLDGCISCANHQLRVEARVFYLANDGADFANLVNYKDSKFVAYKEGKVSPPAAGDAVEYMGSKTGEGYSKDTCSGLPVTWNVSPACGPLKLKSINDWCAKDQAIFKVEHPHPARELVKEGKLLSAIK